MDFLKITRQYYSLFLGKPNILCDSKDAVAFVYSDDRNKTLQGYLDKFDIYALSQNNNIIVSYGNKALSKINALKESDIFDADSLICAIRKTYNRDVAHNVKFYYQRSYESKIAARALDISDYSAYLSFFKKNNPQCKNTDWLEKYFYSMISRRLCCGVFDNDILASCTDSPDMPYLSDKVQEIGINTLYEYRGKGYASAACALCIENILAIRKCPQWSCSYDNIASSRLAEKIGFVKFADALTVTL